MVSSSSVIKVCMWRWIYIPLLWSVLKMLCSLVWILWRAESSMAFLGRVAKSSSILVMVVTRWERFRFCMKSFCIRWSSKALSIISHLIVMCTKTRWRCLQMRVGIFWVSLVELCLMIILLMAIQWIILTWFTTSFPWSFSSTPTASPSSSCLHRIMNAPGCTVFERHCKPLEMSSTSYKQMDLFNS